MDHLLIREGRAAEIMLVEDNRGDALLAARAFRDARIKNNLSIADTGEKALAMLRREGAYADQKTPDIILLDLNLPRMSGEDVLRAIKADAALKSIPVVVLSSSSAEADINRAYEHHANAYVVKPIDLQKFREVAASIEQFFFMLAILPAPEAS
ncbi:response regulator [Asticcacaulis sp. EMRT-3]|uniref:response regulator n=1 Tax=Asticcacaulis sp. EMRT-3 TaxID=3040349 RepID=UPI0024AF6598|nr:response regulator [Asticcacaulis sp. EMRT-3]MDI7775061.1 response regulator [Asticcacaulis sp. EMRT-3]